MNISEAIKMARSWTKDMKDEGISNQMPLWEMVRALLDHIDRQGKDIEELTLACRVLFRENRRKQDELSRSQTPSRSLDD